MTFLRKSQILLLALFAIIFTGCVQNIGPDGLTLRLSPSQLNMESNQFPIRKNFTVADVAIQKPNLSINNTNQIAADINLDLRAILMPTTKATLAIAGEPYFNKEKGAIFLRNVAINNIGFSNNSIAKSFSSSLIPSLGPLIDELFKNIPIYKLDKGSFQGQFVKDVKVQDQALLVTFGI